MKRTFALVLALLMTLGLAGCAQSPAPTTSQAPEASDPQSAQPDQTAPAETQGAAAETLQWSIAGGASGGAYYIIHGGIGDLLNKYSNGRFNTKVEVTGGSQENVHLVGNGDCELGMTNSNLAYFGVQGTAPYSAPENVKAIAALHSSVLSLVVKEGSRYQEIADLKGEKVFLGPAGNGGVPVFEAWVGLYGLTLDDFDCVYMEFAQGVEMFKNEQVEALICLGGFPYSPLTELSQTDDFRHIQFDTAKTDELVGTFPYYSVVTIPANTYKNDDVDSNVIAIANNLLINGDISDEDAYLVTKIIAEHLDELATYHAAAKSIVLENLADTAIDLHPGAAQYYKEAGIL